VRPNHNVWPFADLGGERESMRDFFGCLDRDLHPQIGLEFLNDWLQSSPSISIHPDQKLAIRPAEKVGREQIEEQENRRHLLYVRARVHTVG
jgi:hypothetical protein